MFTNSTSMLIIYHFMFLEKRMRKGNMIIRKQLKNISKLWGSKIIKLMSLVLMIFSISSLNCPIRVFLIINSRESEIKVLYRILVS